MCALPGACGRWLVPVLIGSLLTGCVVQQPMGQPPETAAPPPPPPPSSSDYQRGVEDGQRAGLAAPMEGYFLLGVVAGVAVVAVLVAILTAKDHGGGGGGGGDCITGCYGPVVVPIMPGVVVLPSGYQEGYHAGYQQTVGQRRSSAFWTGFAGGAIIFLGATIVYFSITANRSSVSSGSNAATAAGRPRGLGMAIPF